MAATKVYEIADGTAITSKGVILVEGQEVTKDDFLSEEVFNELVKAKKIIQVTSTDKKPTRTGKAASTPTSSTGAVDAEAEGTKPKSDSKDDSDKGGDTDNNAGDDSDKGGDTGNDAGDAQ